MKTLLLNQDEVGMLIDLDAVLEAVENGYKSFNSGKVIQPDFMCIVSPDTHEGIDFKGGLDMDGGYISIKASSGGYKKNPQLGLPTGMNTVLLFDASTSVLKCIMDGTWITGCRTAAAGAISVKYLARENAEKLCIIGAGNQARRQLRAMIRVRNFTEILVWNASSEALDDYVREMTAETGLTISRCGTAEEAVREADVVVTATRARRGPVVKNQWLKPGTHIVAIGSDMPGKQELEVDIFKNAKIVNDSVELCVKYGDTCHAIQEGSIKQADIHAEIGEILLGKKAGRENQEEITIFDSVGMAIQDNVTVAMLYKSALEKGLGTFYEFFK
ncbi:Ornithine cyclodeaminase [Paraburkholderia atlantica]|uniref:Ornithine cyclodeaminase n=1 Tax=Paraburkholderia atlantica TaxID=2654982 RepID=D5WJ81_PARAM|nr:ornithine cyclodeaminase family protein [Paraburkholderia atlantica]ADG18526.1 Ornithine cyclodeaminase [Paraburkholderia atlantica]